MQEQAQETGDVVIAPGVNQARIQISAIPRLMTVFRLHTGLGQVT